MSLRAAGPDVSDAPWTTRSRARSTMSLTLVSAVSTVLCHPWASLTLLWYCVFCARSPLYCSAWLVPNGLSDGSWICLPDEIRSCVG